MKAKARGPDPSEGLSGRELVAKAHTQGDTGNRRL